MAAEYTIYKDADYPAGDFVITVSGGGLTGASIAYALAPLYADFSQDLDTLAEAGVLLKDNGDNGGVTIVDDENFRVVVSPADTATLTPGTYWALVRVTKSNGELMRLPKHEVEVAA